MQYPVLTKRYRKGEIDAFERTRRLAGFSTINPDAYYAGKGRWAYGPYVSIPAPADILLVFADTLEDPMGGPTFSAEGNVPALVFWEDPASGDYILAYFDGSIVGQLDLLNPREADPNDTPLTPADDFAHVLRKQDA